VKPFFVLNIEEPNTSKLTSSCNSTIFGVRIKAKRKNGLIVKIDDKLVGN
jgi:hypothetical protein